MAIYTKETMRDTRCYHSTDYRTRHSHTVLLLHQRDNERRTVQDSAKLPWERHLAPYNDDILIIYLFLAFWLQVQ